MASIFQGDPFERDVTFAPADAHKTFANRLYDLGKAGVDAVSSFELLKEGDEPSRPFAFDEKKLANIRAAYDQARLINSHTGRVQSLADAASRRIDIVREATGIQLENPFLQGYHMEARRRLQERRERGEIEAYGLPEVLAEQRNIFNENVNLAAERFPDKAAALNFYQPLEDQAKAIAGNAEAAADQAAARVNDPVARFGGQLFGGMGAMIHDPIQVVGLAAGAGPATGSSMAIRMLQTTLREGLINAGLQALEEPAVQQWRAEIGLQSGLEPALENIGMAALIGSVIGGGAATVRELISPLRRLAIEDQQAIARVLMGDGTATADDALRAAKAMGVELPPEVREIIELAQAAERANAETIPPAPSRVDAEAHGEAIEQAVRAADDPNVMPPPAPLAAREAGGVPNDPAAQAAIQGIREGALDLMGTAKALRAYPGIDDGTLPLSGDRMQLARGLAALSDDAFAKVQAGEVPAQLAAWAGRVAPDRPDLHAGMLADMARLEVANATDAARVAYAGLEGSTSINRHMAAANIDLWSQWMSLKAEAERLRTEMRDTARLAADAKANGAGAELEAQLAALRATLAGAKGKARKSLEERIADLEASRPASAETPFSGATVDEQKAGRRARLVEVDTALRDLIEPMQRLRQEADDARVAGLRAGLSEPVEPGGKAAAYQAEAMAVAPEAPKAETAPVVREPAGNAVAEPVAPRAPPSRGLFEDIAGRNAEFVELIARADERGGRFDLGSDLVSVCKI